MNTSTQTTIEPFGLVTISGTVKRNGYYTAGEPDEPPYYIENLIVTADGETIQGWKTEDGKRRFVCSLEQWQIDNCEEVLIDKFIGDEKAYKDTLIDEAIERGKEYKHFAYA